MPAYPYAGHFLCYYAAYMDKISFSSVTVFILFFGIMLIAAIQRQNWLEAGLFAALGLVSLVADLRRK